MAGERFAGGMTPFALCVKRSEVNLTKVDSDEERERKGGGVQGRWAWPAQISQCVETEANPAREVGGGEGALELSYKPRQLLGNVVFVATHTCGTCCCCCCKHVALTLCQAVRKEGDAGRATCAQLSNKDFN